MTTIQIKDDLYQRLRQCAVQHHSSVEDILKSALDHLSASSTQTALVSAQERRQAFNEWMDLVQNRDTRYPKDFVVDDSRDGLYAGRGE